MPRSVSVRAIGSDLRVDYTAVGQTTHLAARMEQLADPGTILLTADTLHLVEGFVTVKPLGPVPVKGMKIPVEVYELTGARPSRASWAGPPSWSTHSTNVMVSASSLAAVW